VGPFQTSSNKNVMLGLTSKNHL